jgi:hypothetical protein
MGNCAYPMRYQPMADKHAFEKESYVSPNWTVEQLNDALEVASAVFAIFAAALWLASSRVETPREFPIKITSWHTYDGEEVTGAQVVGEGSGTSENMEALSTHWLSGHGECQLAQVR